jgi:hypothetical protein
MRRGTHRALLYKRPAAAPGGATFAYLAGASALAGASGGNTGGNLIDTTGAGLLVASLCYYAGGSVTDFGDDKSNTWTMLTEAANGVAACRVYYTVPSSVGASSQVYCAGTGIFATLVFAAFSGGAASPADQQSQNSGTSSSSATSSSITPGFNNELVIAACCNGGTAGANSINESFTIIDAARFGDSTNYLGGAAAYKIQTTAAAAAPTWTLSSAQDWATKMASFKAS